MVPIGREVTGVVLAGGSGTRLHPMTQIVNKHLLDVFDEPMIFYPIRKLAQAGIEDVILVTGTDIDRFKQLLGDGTSLGVNLTYLLQESELGVADALRMASIEAGDVYTVVMLGDNLFQDDLTNHVERYLATPSGAKVLLKRVDITEADEMGVAIVRDGRIHALVEKPRNAVSDLVVTGCYMYDATVLEILESLDMSDRGEFEITDVNNVYLERNQMTFEYLSGWWVDAGTPLGKLRASTLIALEKGADPSAVEPMKDRGE